MATGVAVGKTLLIVGHRPMDPTSEAATAAAGPVQVSVERAIAALDPPLGMGRRGGAYASRAGTESTP